MLPLTKVEQYIRKHLPYNVTVGFLDGGMFGVALGFALVALLLPRIGLQAGLVFTWDAA